MKSADIPAVFFTVDQPINRIMGDKNIPPPTPIKPETKPTMAPIKRAKGMFTGFRSF